MTLTAKDGNDRTVRNYEGTKCLVFSGPADSPNGTHPSYPVQGSCLTGQSAVPFSNGIASPAVKVFLAAATTLTVSDTAIPFGGSSPSFTVIAGHAAILMFSAAPIDTKVGTPIYSVCVPDPIRPCALVPASTPVAVSQVDVGGNPSADTVSIGNVHATASNGIATFGDALIINQTGSATLHATTTAASVDSASFQIVFDLKACTGQSCKNSVDNGAKNIQRAVNTITTSTGDFFAGGANVRLATSFFDTAGECGVSTFVGQGTEAKVEGPSGPRPPRRRCF